MTISNGLLRLIGIAFRRYSRDPETRTHTSRQMLCASVALYAEETTPGEAALAVSETLTSIVQAERVAGRMAR